MHDRVDTQSSVANFILAGLPAQEFALLRPALQLVSFPNGHFVALAGDALKRFFFPNCGMISMLAETENGHAIEVGFTGVEGMMGTPILLGKNSMPYQALVQAPVEGYVADAPRVIELFERRGAFHDAVLRYAYVELRQAAQTAVCNHFHPIQARMCRWLTVMCERSGERNLRLTQEFLAHMLGVQRTSIGAIANTMQKHGIIAYRRGKVEITDVDRVRAAACECYHLIKAEHAELAPKKARAQVSSTRQTVTVRTGQTTPELFRKK